MTHFGCECGRYVFRLGVAWLAVVAVSRSGNVVGLHAVLRYDKFLGLNECIG
jgi:3'-phosphoadenosine 5'-phosphosulfate sulfotransferase